MIPKVIHYCWFGRNTLPKLAIKCIASWKKYLPDYEIIEWNEENFDININTYVKEAYEAKKWAFISDYVRVNALYNYGGIYMDTDVEVTKNLDEFLKCGAFSGFEDESNVPTGIMGAEKNHSWVKNILNQYKDKKFIKDDGSYDLTTNLVLITDVTKKYYNIVLDNSYQELKDRLVIYPKQYFCPKSYETGRIELTINTHTIHHFNGSWHSDEEKQFRKRKRLLSKIIGNKLTIIILNYIGYLEREGIYKSIKKLLEKIY